MTTDNVPSNSGSTPQPAPAGKAPEPQPSQGVPSADFDAAVGRENAAHVERTGALSPSEIKTQADKIFNDKNSQYWKGGPDHDAQVALVFKSKELAAAAEGNQGEALTTGERVHNRNLQHLFPKELGGDPRELANDAELSNLMKWADSENVATPILGELISEYANHIAGSGQLSEAAMDQMEAKFRGQLRADQIRLLRKWASLELNPALARRRRGR